MPIRAVAHAPQRSGHILWTATGSTISQLQGDRVGHHDVRRPSSNQGSWRRSAGHCWRRRNPRYRPIAATVRQVRRLPSCLQQAVLGSLADVHRLHELEYIPALAEEHQASSPLGDDLLDTGVPLGLDLAPSVFGRQTMTPAAPSMGSSHQAKPATHGW